LVPHAFFSAAESVRFYRRLGTTEPYGFRFFLRQAALVHYFRSRIISENIRIICAYNLLRTGYLALRLGEEHGVPFLMFNFGEIYANLDLLRRTRALREFAAHIVQKSAGLLSCSRHCASSYELIGLSADVKVVDTCVDTRMFHPANDGGALRKRMRIPEHDILVMFVGRMVADMGLDSLLEIIPLLRSSHPNVSVLIAGTQGELTQSVKETSRMNPGKVFFATDVTLEDLPSCYAASDIVVAPTAGARACSSLAALEAMASGKPVVAAGVGGIPEVVHDRETGMLIPPGDPGALARAVLALVRDKDLRRRLGSAGRTLVKERFDKDIANKVMVNMFNAVVGS
jgi:glycosyltransferase involved in cell wall biosynthesis